MATETRIFTCTNCKKEVLVELPAFEVVNGKFVSAVFFAHPKPDVCNHCGQTFLFAINKQAAVNVNFAWYPIVVEKEQESNIILPPSNVDKKKFM